MSVLSVLTEMVNNVNLISPALGVTVLDKNFNGMTYPVYVPPPPSINHLLENKEKLDEL